MSRLMRRQISQLPIFFRHGLRVGTTLLNRSLDLIGRFFMRPSETRSNGISRNGYSILVPRIIEIERNVVTKFTIYLAFLYFNLVRVPYCLYLMFQINNKGMLFTFLFCTSSEKVLCERSVWAREFGII